MKIAFGSKELCKCLIKLGFKEKPQKATSHQKFHSAKVPPVGVHPFITVILGRKSYDPTTRSRYITQIKRLGFTKKEIENGLGY